ncbi:MAG: thioesterase family protein [Pseudomonadota bacterium]
MIQIRLADRITLQLCVNTIGTKSFGYDYKLVNRSDPSTVYAAGESVQVCYDYSRNESTVIPDEIRERLSAYLKRSERRG